MSLARIKELQKLIETLWKSGEVSAQTRLEVGKAIEGIQKERSAARTMADVSIEDPLGLLELSYGKSAALGDRWIPPWETTNIKPTRELKGYKPQYPKEEVLSAVETGIIKKQKVGMLADLPEKDISDLTAELRDVQATKETYRALAGTPGVSKEYTATRLTELRAKEERLTRQIYGKALWEAKQSDYLSEYRRQTHPGEASAQYFFTGEPTTGAHGSTLLTQKSLGDIQTFLRKKGIFTESQTELRRSTETELSFIESVLVNPERAAEYERKAATPYFYEYWTKRGGLPGLKEHKKGLKEAMQQEAAGEITPLYAKWGQLKTIEEAKSGTGPPFASLQGEVVELWEPSSPRIKQVGLVEDISGERIKFTTWKNQPNAPTLEEGGRYYFGNVFLKEFQGKWGFEIKKTSKVEKVEGPLFYEGKSASYGASTDIRDYTKPYSIDPKKGTITYTTKGGKVVEMPVSEVGTTGTGAQKITERKAYSPYDKWSAQQERELFNPYAAFVPLPFMAAPWMMQPGSEQSNLTNGTAQMAEQQMTQSQREQALKAAMRGHHEQFMSIANVPVELGGKWLQKGQEAYASLMARQEEYAADPSKQRRFRPFAFFEDLPYLAMGALDVLGGALYPFNYPMQAAWGTAEGMGPMEGIRQEITPAQVLGIEDPWQALAANLIGDPTNWVAIGALSKGAKARKFMEMLGVSKKGLKTFAADESAMLSPRKDYLLEDYRNAFDETIEFLQELGRVDPTDEAAFNTAFKRFKFANKEYNQIEGDYFSPVRVEERWTKAEIIQNEMVSLPEGIKSRLEAEKAKIPETPTKYPKRGYAVEEGITTTRGSPWSAEGTEQFSGAQLLDIQQYDEDLQRAMIQKAYGTLEPKATIGGKQTVQISEAEKEKALKELAEYRRLIGIAVEEEPAMPTILTSYPKQEAPAVSAVELARAQADDMTEAMVQKAITQREIRGEATTAEDTQRIRESIVASQKQASTSSVLAKTGAPRLSSQDKWLLGGGTALVGAGWLGHELTKKETDPWAAANTPPLQQVPMHPGYTERSSKFDPFAAYGGIGNLTNMTTPAALPTAQAGTEGEDRLGLLWKAVDILSTVSYAEGAAIDYLRTGEWKGIGAKITPSEALGITPEGEDVALWRHALGFALDVGIDPTTYLSFGAGSAVKVVGTGGSKLALSAKGVKELGTMRKALTPKSVGVMADAKRLAVGEELGTKEFIAKIESDPAFRKQMLSSEGMSMRGWGLLFPGMEKEILSKQSMDWMLAGPRKVLSAAGETSVGQGLARRFVAFHDIKKLARPANMPVGEAEYVDKYFAYKKKVPYLQKQAVNEAAEMAKQAKELLGDDYQEIMAQLIEAPVTRGASNVPTKAREIAEKIEKAHKEIAEAEKARGILDAEVESMGYLKHMLTPEAREYLKAGKKMPGDISGKWGTQTGSSIQRGHKGTLTEINEEARKTLGFDLFEPDPFTAYATRKVESIKAVETYDYLEYVEKYYGKASVPSGEAAQFDTVGIQQLKGVNLPKPIAEHLGEEFAAQKSGAREVYDKLLTAWKYTATVPFPAYHAQNVVGGLGYNAMLLGDTSVLSAATMVDILKGGGRQKKYTSALGQELTGEQIVQKLGEHGVLGQPGQMDIPLAMKTKLGGAKTTGEKATGAVKSAVEAPVKLAMAEEDLIRGSMALDRWLKGDTWEQAADWAIKHQFGYSPERYTKFERDVILPIIPFYKFGKGNIQLQFEYAAKQSGKQLLLPRATQQGVGEDESLDDWVFGYAAMNLNAQAMGMMGFREDTIAYFRTPEENMQIAENPLEYTWLQTAPWFKMLGELVTQKYLPGTKFEKDYSELSWSEGMGGAAPIANMVAGRPLATYEYMTDPYMSQTEKLAKSITSTGTAQLPSDKEARGLFGQQFARPGSTTYEQRYATWKRDQYKSGSGISGLQLQTGHIVPAEWGGKPEPGNLITQTFEENMEQAAAQKRRQTLPWRIEQEKEFIRKLRLTSAEKLGEAAAKKDDWGRPMNAAQLEKVKYDRRKSDNLSLYQRLINHLNTEISWVEKELYTEEKALEEKAVKGIKDPVSEAQISAMKKLLAKYTAKRDELVRRREEEQAKEFELPVQGADWSKLHLMDIGHGDEYTVRHGKRPELAKEEDILSLAEDTDELISPLVSPEELTLGREVVQGAPWAVDYRNLSFYPQQGAELMWTATENYRPLQEAAEPLVKELYSEGLGRPSEAVFSLPAKAVRRTSGDIIKETREQGDVPAEAGTGAGAGECRAIDYEDPAFIAAVQNILIETLSEGAMTD